MTHAINWFEIPAVDFDRAADFYENIFGIALKRGLMNGRRLGIFPYEPPATGGCVIEDPSAQPGPDGPIIYLNASTDVEAVLSQIEGHGGLVVMKCTRVSDEIGDIGVFIDTEGNRLGLHKAP